MLSYDTCYVRTEINNFEIDFDFCQIEIGMHINKMNEEIFDGDTNGENIAGNLIQPFCFIQPIGSIIQ
jgi:hypothetical protein